MVICPVHMAIKDSMTGTAITTAVPDGVALLAECNAVLKQADHIGEAGHSSHLLNVSKGRLQQCGSDLGVQGIIGYPLCCSSQLGCNLSPVVNAVADSRRVQQGPNTQGGEWSLSA